MPDAITRDTAFVDELNTKMAADGLTFAGAGVSADVDALVGTDGLRCRWAMPHTDIVVRYANWARDTAAWESLKTKLLADGYSKTGPLDVARTASRPIPPTASVTASSTMRARPGPSGR